MNAFAAPVDHRHADIPPLGGRVQYASDVREGDLLVLPQPPLVRVTKIRVYENGAPLSAKMVTFARWPFEAMQVFRRWDEDDAPGAAD